MSTEKLRADIINLLQKHPDGLKAREIANYITGVDKKSINQILYANPKFFSATDYVWTLIPQELPKKIEISLPKKSALLQTKSNNAPSSSISKSNSTSRQLQEADENDEKISLYLRGLFYFYLDDTLSFNLNFFKFLIILYIPTPTTTVPPTIPQIINVFLMAVVSSSDS